MSKGRGKRKMHRGGGRFKPAKQHMKGYLTDEGETATHQLRPNAKERRAGLEGGQLLVPLKRLNYVPSGKYTPKTCNHKPKHLRRAENGKP